MNAIRTKTLKREDWPRILERQQAYMPFAGSGFHGVACLMRLNRVKEPLISDVFGAPMTILDNGYTWLQIAPADAHWWLSVMFTGRGKLQQCYFDVTRQNHIIYEDSTFEDLLLDVVVHPDGRIVVLDADELEDALHSGTITAEEYDLAWDVAAYLERGIKKHLPELVRFCYQTLEAMKPMLK